MAAIIDSRLWLPLLVLLASGLLPVVHPAVPTEEEMLQASIVYRKKPGTADVIKCSETVDCFLQKEFCAAFYMGDNFYVTGAHCLVAKDGTIPDPQSLDVLGAGVVNVTFTVHKHYASTTGVDIAWIHIEDPRFSSHVLVVAEEHPTKCIRYNLEVYDTNPKDIHSGFHWIRQQKTPHPKPAKMDPLSKGVLAFEYRKHLERNKTTEHVIMCSLPANPDDFELHFIAQGTLDKISFDIDCHRARCGVVKPENMQDLPPTTTTTEPPKTTAPTTTTTSIESITVTIAKPYLPVAPPAEPPIVPPVELLVVPPAEPPTAPPTPPPAIAPEDTLYGDPPTIVRITPKEYTAPDTSTEPTYRPMMPSVTRQIPPQENPPRGQPAFSPPSKPNWVPEQGGYRYDVGYSEPRYWRYDVYGRRIPWGGSGNGPLGVTYWGWYGRPARVGGGGSQRTPYWGDGGGSENIPYLIDGSEEGPYWGRPNWTNGEGEPTTDDDITTAIPNSWLDNDIPWDSHELNVSYFAGPKSPSNTLEVEPQPSYGSPYGGPSRGEPGSWWENDIPWDSPESNVGYFAELKIPSSTPGIELKPIDDDSTESDDDPTESVDELTYTGGDEPAWEPEVSTNNEPTSKWSPDHKQSKTGDKDFPKWPNSGPPTFRGVSEILERIWLSKDKPTEPSESNGSPTLWREGQILRELPNQPSSELPHSGGQQLWIERQPTCTNDGWIRKLTNSGRRSRGKQLCIKKTQTSPNPNKHDQEQVPDKIDNWPDDTVPVAGSLISSARFYSPPVNDPTVSSPVATGTGAGCLTSKHIPNTKHQIPIAINAGIRPTRTETVQTGTKSIRPLFAAKCRVISDPMKHSSTGNDQPHVGPKESQTNVTTTQTPEMRSYETRRMRRKRIQMLPGLKPRGSVAPPGAVLNGTALVPLAMLGCVILMMLI